MRLRNTVCCNLLDLNKIDIGASGGDVPVSATAVGMSHVAVEDDVFAIATNGGMRLGSEVLHGASTGMSQTIDFRAAVVGIDARQNELVLV